MWPVYVINLDRATRRWDRSQAVLNRIGIPHSRFSARDWKQLDDAQLARSCRLKPDWRARAGAMTLPEVACYFSHVALWNIVASGDARGAIILEDDFDCAADTAEVLDAISSRTPDWDMLKLFSEKPRALKAATPMAAHYRVGTPYILPMSTLAYAITREAAKGLAEALVPIGRPIDIDLKHWWEHDAMIKLVMPSPFWRRDDYLESSEIDEARRQLDDETKTTPPARALRNLVYQFKFHARSARHFRRRRGDQKWKPATT